MVRGGYDIRVVLYDYDGIPLISQCPERLQQFLDIIEMKSGGGFVEDEEDMPVIARLTLLPQE